MSIFDLTRGRRDILRPFIQADWRKQEITFNSTSEGAVLSALFLSGKDGRLSSFNSRGNSKEGKPEFKDN